MGGMEAKVEIWNICFIIGKERELHEMTVLRASVQMDLGRLQEWAGGNLRSSIKGNVELSLGTLVWAGELTALDAGSVKMEQKSW